MLKIFIQIDENEQLKTSKKHQDNIRRIKLGEAIKNIVMAKDGQMIEQGMSEYKVVFILKIMESLEFNVCCHFRMEEWRLCCETKISDYRLRRFIKQYGEIAMMREINKMNQEMIQAKVVFKNRAELISIYTTYYIAKNFETSGFTTRLENIWKAFANHFSKLYSKFQRSKIKSAKSSSFLSIKRQAEENQSFKLKNTQQSSVIICSANSINVQIEENNKIQRSQTRDSVKVSAKLEQYASAKPILRFIQIQKIIEIVENQKRKLEGGSSVLDQHLYIFYKYTASSIDMTIFSNDNPPNSDENSDQQAINSSEEDSLTNPSSRNPKKGIIKSKQNYFLHLAANSREKSAEVTESTEENKIKCEEILVRKFSMKDDPGPFTIELQIIKYLKDEKCPYVASYFFDKIGYEEFDHLDRIYLQFYPFSIQHAKCETLILLFINILKGIQFLNSRDIIHRDLKPANILMDTKFIPKIIDFGSSSFASSSTTSKLKKKVQQQPLRTTRYYNRFYSDLCEEIRQKYGRKEFQRHELYDMYAFGRIIKVFLETGPVKQKLGNFIFESLSYLSKKCSQQNPDDRLQPSQALHFLEKLQKTQQKILKKIN